MYRNQVRGVDGQLDKQMDDNTQDGQGHSYVLFNALQSDKMMEYVIKLLVKMKWWAWHRSYNDSPGTRSLEILNICLNVLG